MRSRLNIYIRVMHRYWTSIVDRSKIRFSEETVCLLFRCLILLVTLYVVMNVTLKKIKTGHVKRGTSAVECQTRNRESQGSKPLYYRFEVCAFLFCP